MLQTISKRFRFSASRRLVVPSWSDARNREHFGGETGARYGSGRNYGAVLVFRGEIDPATGMLVNVAEIKARMTDLIDERYDHRFLNADTPPFGDLVPTMENVARQLLDDAMPLFGDLGAELVACHLTESPDREATAYRDGTVEAHHWLAWSAVRRTMAPDLTASENAAYFGEAATHDRGHRYRLRVTLGGDRDADTGLLAPLAVVAGATATLRDDLAHRHLNHEVPSLKGRPTTTESVVRWLDECLGDTLPIARLRLFEGPGRFAEHHPDGGTRIGLERWFDAAHRLHSPHLDDAGNRRVYGKCNNPSGHGHTYRIEATLAAPYDERSGTVGDFTALRQGMDAAVEPWHDHHLDLQTDDFRDRPSTSENILQVLWPRLEGSLRGQLSRVRLWETENNRFALRRKVESGALAAG